jgi:ABC-type nitrate/sulfonate/bicarbonate transport system substrate-binding protein
VHPSLARRRFLALATLTGAGAVLAACGVAAPAAAPSGAPSSAAPASASPSAAAAPSAKPAASPKPAASGATAATLKVAYVVAAATQSPIWMAQETGAFARHNVAVDVQLIESSVSLKALLVKQVDVVLQSASSLIQADLNGQADLVYVGSASNHSQGELLTAPSIKSAADLKGKVIGSDKPGTASDYYTQLELKLLGLTSKDVSIRPVGNGDIVLQGLISGQIQAGTMTAPQSLDAEAKGFYPLQNTYSQPYQGNGPIVLRGRVQELKPQLLPFLAAFRDGIEAFNEQPDLAKATIGKYAKIDDQAVLARTYAFFHDSSPFQLDLKPTLPGIQAMLDFLSPTLEAAKTAKPEQFVDLSLVEQLPPL